MEFVTLTEEEFVKASKTFDNMNFFQTPQIGKLRESKGWEIHYLGVKEDKKIIACAMFVSKNKLLGKREFYSPRGFLMDYSNKELFEFFTKEVKEYVRINNGYVFRIDPAIINIERDINGNVVEGGIDNSNIKKQFLDLGYKPIDEKHMEQIHWMYVLPIEGKTSDELFKEMKSNTRNIIRKVEKDNFEIVELKKDELSEFYNVLKETGERKGFKIRSLEYFEEMYDLFGDDIKYIVTRLNLKEHMKMLEEEKDKAIKDRDALSYNKANDGKRKAFEEQINGLDKKINLDKDIMEKTGKEVITLSGSQFMLTYPEVLYLNSGNYDEYMMYNSQYLIQWNMIKYAVEHGYKRYNFYGISGNFDRNDKDFGMYEFKTRFNGHVEELIGEYEMPIGWSYKLIKLLTKIKNR